MYTIMKSLGVSHIDVLSLDVEGAEMKIFDTIPWDKVSFTVSIKINGACTAWSPESSEPPVDKKT